MATLGWSLLVLALLGSHLVAHARGVTRERARCRRIIACSPELTAMQAGRLISAIGDADEPRDDDGDDDGGVPMARPA